MLRSFSHGLLALVSLSLLCGYPAQAQATDDEPGQLIVVPANRESIEVNVGDLVQVPFSFPIIPGSMLSNLKVSVSGQCVRHVTVVNTPELVNGRPLVGNGRLSAFLLAERQGDATVTVVPVKLNGEAAEKRTLHIRVGLTR